MTEALLSIVAYLLPIIVAGITATVERQKGTDYEANIQAFRKTLDRDNPVDRSALLADQHDRVRLATSGGGRRS